MKSTITDTRASRHAPAAALYIVGRLRGRPGDSRNFTNEVKLEFAEFLAVHGGASSWVRDRLWKRLGVDGDHWRKLCGACHTRFAEALSEFRQAKARQVPGREGWVQQREARALTKQQQQQEEDRKRWRDAVQQQQQRQEQEQEGNGDGQPCRLGRTRAATASAAAVQAGAVAAAAVAAAPASPAPVIGAAAAAAAAVAAGFVAAALGVGGSGGSSAGRASPLLPQVGGWSSASATPTHSHMQIHILPLSARGHFRWGYAQWYRWALLALRMGVTQARCNN